MNAANDEYLMPRGGASITALPKVSLHDHLDGGLRPQTIIELAAEIGHDLPETDAASLGSWFAEKSDSGSLVEYLKTFDITTAVMQTHAGLVRVAREFVEDLAADGVIYGEVRWRLSSTSLAGSVSTRPSKRCNKALRKASTSSEAPVTRSALVSS